MTSRAPDHVTLTAWSSHAEVGRRYDDVISSRVATSGLCVDTAFRRRSADDVVLSTSGGAHCDGDDGRLSGTTSCRRSVTSVTCYSFVLARRLLTSVQQLTALRITLSSSFRFLRSNSPYRLADLAIAYWRRIDASMIKFFCRIVRRQLLNVATVCHWNRRDAPPPQKKITNC